MVCLLGSMPAKKRGRLRHLRGQPALSYMPARQEKLMLQVHHIPVAAHCVRPLRSARLIIRIIRRDRSVTGLAKTASPAPARLPSLSLLHNKIM